MASPAGFRGFADQTDEHEIQMTRELMRRSTRQRRPQEHVDEGQVEDVDNDMDVLGEMPVAEGEGTIDEAIYTTFPPQKAIYQHKTLMMDSDLIINPDQMLEEEPAIEEEAPADSDNRPPPAILEYWSRPPPGPASGYVNMEPEAAFDTTGLKDIGNLASWTVSTFKPGCGVEELRSEDTNLFWQSDGPQPHYLNVHFTRFASIRAIRLYLDFDTDESYTPTRINMYGGTGYHDLTPFANLHLVQPKGWIDVDLKGVGGGADGNTLRAFLIQVKIVENHQNGKDTHLRGMKIYAADDKAGQSKMGSFDDFFGTEEVKGKNKEGDSKSTGGQRKAKLQKSMFTEPDWMTEPELR